MLSRKYIALSTIVNHCQLLSTTKDIILCIKVLLINLQQLAPSADILDQQFLGNLFSMNANKDTTLVSYQRANLVILQ